MLASFFQAVFPDYYSFRFHDIARFSIYILFEKSSQCTGLNFLCEVFLFKLQDNLNSPVCRVKFRINIYKLPLLCRVGPHAKVLKIFENWHVAFHGTQAQYLQPIFNNGAQLLMAGKTEGKFFKQNMY